MTSLRQTVVGGRTIRTWLALAAASAILAATLLLFGPTASADQIMIENPGFETPALLDGGDAGLTGWSDDDLAVVFNPTTAQITSEAGEGQNVALTSTPGFMIAQVLSDKLSAGTYVLSAQVGEDATPVFAGYTVELLAGGEVLASTSSPAQGLSSSKSWRNHCSKAATANTFCRCWNNLKASQPAAG